jgi:hypothetical protein
LLICETLIRSNPLDVIVTDSVQKFSKGNSGCRETKTGKAHLPILQLQKLLELLNSRFSVAIWNDKRLSLCLGLGLAITRHSRNCIAPRFALKAPSPYADTPTRPTADPFPLNAATFPLPCWTVRRPTSYTRLASCSV